MFRMCAVWLALAAAMFAVAAPGWGDDQKACRLLRITALDMGTSQAGGATIPASIGDHPVTLEVDTAGVFTSFSEGLIAQLGIPYDVEPGSRIFIYSGIPVRHFARISNLKIGSLPVHTLTFPLTPQNMVPVGLDGFAGPDLLANFDLDFDFADAKLNLFSKDHCAGKVVYWTRDPSAVVRIPMKLDDDMHISVPVTLDGQEFTATIDTGADGTGFSLDSAEDSFSLKNDSPGMRRVPAPNGLAVAYTYPFKQLSFGGVTVDHPHIVMVPDSEAQQGPKATDMIIGMNVLRHLHLYIAYEEHALYVSSASAH